MIDVVVVERRDDGVVVVVLNRPAVRNAINTEMLRDLRTELRHLDDDEGVGAIVLTGADPAFVGRGMARRMSLTGDFLSAADALRVGLVTEVVPHDELLPVATAVAATIAGNERSGVQTLLASYRRVEAELVGDGDRVEAATGRDWLASNAVQWQVGQRREAIIARDRDQAQG